MAGFNPRFHPTALDVKFRSGEFVFVVSMGDLFGSWVPAYAIDAILDVVDRFPKTDFLLQTKNPARYLEFDLPPNVYAGVTLESEFGHGVSKAPPPISRWESMLLLPPGTRKFVSVEPIMDFDPLLFIEMLCHLRPDIIEIGADNYGHGLPEPSWEKVEELIRHLREICPDVMVKEKDGLRRLAP